MTEYIYRAYGLIHQLAKLLQMRRKPSSVSLFPTRIAKGCDHINPSDIWQCFLTNSIVQKGGEFEGTHFAGYIVEKKVWCLPSWIWTNSAIVRLCCENGDLNKAVELGEIIARYQQACGGWIVRNDYDSKGAIPMLAPNDSAYIANNAFLSLYEATKETRYLDIAKRCADWIIETARPDRLVFTGYNMRDKKWDKANIIVDTGFTGGLFSKLIDITGEEKYKSFLEKFILRYIELFYIPDKKGFCTSIGKNDQQQGGMFARGQAWALEGLIPTYHVLKNVFIKEIIENTIDNLLNQQCKNGGWPYNITHKLMGEDCKAVSILAKNMMDWYAYTKDERILKSAKRALDWCCKHTAIEGDAKGGIFSYCMEGAIVKDLYTTCAFVYASAYAIELQKQIEDAENHTH